MATSKSEVSRLVEIEVCGPNGAQLFFDPIRTALRGRMDFSACESRTSGSLREIWREPIPGMVIGVDFSTGEKYIREPIHAKEHAKLQLKIKDMGLLLADEKVFWESETLTTWLYWMRRAIDSKHAKVLVGDLPALSTFEGEETQNTPIDTKPRKDFYGVTPKEDPIQTLTKSMLDLVERNTRAIEMLVKLIESKA